MDNTLAFPQQREKKLFSSSPYKKIQNKNCINCYEIALNIDFKTNINSEMTIGVSETDLILI